MRPVIYLDVDGVLNALDHQEYAHGRHAWGDFLIHPNVKPDDIPFGQMGFDLYMSKAMVAALAALPADVVWLTTWRHDAPRHVAPLVDAPDWPVLDWGYSKGAAVAQDQAANPRPFVWIDDTDASYGELIYHTGEAPEVPYLIIKPDSLQGITRDHIEEITYFLNWLQEISYTPGHYETEEV